MKSDSIEQAKDRDLAGSVDAMRRAAVRARQVAAQTGTDLIVWRDGRVQHETVPAQETLPKMADA